MGGVGKEIDDALQSLVDVVGMQGGKADVDRRGRLSVMDMKKKSALQSNAEYIDRYQSHIRISLPGIIQETAKRHTNRKNSEHLFVEIVTVFS